MLCCVYVCDRELIKAGRRQEALEAVEELKEAGWLQEGLEVVKELMN